MGRARAGTAAFRDDVEQVLHDFVERSRPPGSTTLGPDAAEPGRPGAHRASRAASGSAPPSAGGATRPSARPSTRPLCCARAPRWSCCTRAPWSTTTTWTPPTYDGDGRRPTARSSRCTASGVARAPRSRTAPRPRSCSATCCSAGPTSCCAPAACRAERVLDALGYFDLTRSEVVDRAVPRRLGAGAGLGRRRHGDDRAALQVREVLHRAAAPHRRGARPAPRRADDRSS